MKGNTKTIILYVVLIAGLILASLSLLSGKSSTEEITYGKVIEMFRDNKVTEFNISSNNLLTIKTTEIGENDKPKSYQFRLRDLYLFYSDVDAYIDAQLALPAEERTLVIEKCDLEAPKQTSWLVSLLPYLIILVIGVAFWFYMANKLSDGERKMTAFSRARVKVPNRDKTRVYFSDVAGADEEKEELREVVEYLRDPTKYRKLGAKIPRGVLLVGPPGTGKTLLAKATAGEADVPFFSISGSDFVEMYVGVGASRVRDLFETAKKAPASIIFIDEIDAVGRRRGTGLGGGHDEREQTLNQLLVEMDGFAPNEGIIVIAATNRPDILDPALLRPGRFDRQVTVNYPDVKGREDILRVHARNKPLAEGVKLSVLAQRTPGFTGADLENVLNEAAILAARAHHKTVDMPELEEAITRVIMGPEKRSRVITELDKRLTAYHEAGHAIVALKLKNCDPVHEVSIVPRGLAGGYTMYLPKEDKTYVTRSKLEDSIAAALGGRVAEKLRLGDISTGAHSDLQHASEIAHRMVTEYGMSEEIGPIFLGGQTEVFVGLEWGHERNYSEALAARVDDAVQKILAAQFERAEQAIASDLEALDRVADMLIRYERVTGDEFAAVYNGADAEQVLGRSDKAASADGAKDGEGASVAEAAEPERTQPEPSAEAAEPAQTEETPATRDE